MNSKSDFEQFCDAFTEIKLPFKMNDSLAFEDWNTENLIDTNYIKLYGLLTKHTNKNYPLKNLLDYKCSYVGRYNAENYLILIYKTYTTEAGRGNPEMVLVTFTKDGKKNDEITALWNDAEDPLYAQRITLNIATSNTIEIKSVIKVNGYIDGQIVPKKISEKTLNYMILKDGKIKAEPEIFKDVFVDDNPKILEDFPQD
jgi:hypothetical protein